MTNYVIAGKFGPIALVNDKDKAQERAEEIYKGRVYKAGFFEAKKVRRQLSENKLEDMDFETKYQTKNITTTQEG